ncbi:MAG TPA: hypothetical protein VI111_02210 [Thermoleophilaceae bacterium]
MNSRRAILPALALALALSAPAWASTSSGGVSRPADKAGTAAGTTAAGGSSSSTAGGAAVADPMRPGPGGGAPAPAGVVNDAQSAAVPQAGAAQEPTPTTPQGGPQEPEPDVPTDNGDDQTGDNGNTGDTTGDQPSDEAGAQQPSSSDGGGSALGFLPHTGLELAALAGFGLALLLAGMALLRGARMRRPKLR